MFEFLKKLFGRKPKTADQRVEEETTAIQQEPVSVQQYSTPQVSAPVQAQPRPQAQATVETPAKPTPISPTHQPAIQRDTPVVQRPVEQKKSPAETPTRQPAVSPISKPAVQLERPTVSKPAPKVEEPWRSVPSKPAEPKTGAPSSTRRVVAPRVQRSAETASNRRQQKTSVYVGLDFGTTFTKAAYEIAPSNVHTKYSIKFGKGNSACDYYLPSVLYYDPDAAELNIFNETGEFEEVRYFKYNIISDALQKNKVLNDPNVKTKTPKEQLCCVFFLGYVISLIRDSVHETFGKTILNENTSWYINMGVPLEAHKEDARAMLYKKVLGIAYLFEQKNHGRTEISIQELDDFFVSHKDESNPNINILPEIYAEVLLYQQYLNTPAGFYTVVDIGGGTEDIATFLKMTDEFGEKVECLAQNVIGYGYDSIAEKIVKRITPTTVQRAKSFLNKGIEFNDDTCLRDSVPKEVEHEEVLDARRECRTLFGSCVQRARKTREDILKQTVSAKLPMHVFVMGGARDVEFYRSSIEFMKKVQGNAGIPFFKDADVFDYVGRNTRLEIRNDQRLVISQMLAQPYEMIPEIDKMPWDLKEHDVTAKGMSWLDLHARQDELYPD